MRPIKRRIGQLQFHLNELMTSLLLIHDDNAASVLFREFIEKEIKYVILSIYDILLKFTAPLFKVKLCCHFSQRNSNVSCLFLQLVTSSVRKGIKRILKRSKVQTKTYLEMQLDERAEMRS